MVFIENEGALFRGPSRSNPTEVYVGGGKGWIPYADAGKEKPISWGYIIDGPEVRKMMEKIDAERD
ncbi:hypothetical protein [Methylomagnum ishizawai]|uniref:hypothetical protein n=1 Tax=Methylomagnum ishizawai TaxID=1760988 RepID=UPI000F738FAA|nr:hypothetical protein [Methylomagnum ishizawai]